MVEGDLWIHGQTDLGDLYRERLTLRQVWVRLVAMPAEAGWWGILRAEHEKAEAAQQESEIKSLLAQFQPKKEG